MYRKTDKRDSKETANIKNVYKHIRFFKIFCANLAKTVFIYYLSKKSCPFLYIKRLYHNQQDLLDNQHHEPIDLTPNIQELQRITSALYNHI